MKYILLIILFLFFVHPVRAQQNGVKHFTTEDGLSGNHIYYIIQDQKGFIWIATDNGVSRFDGKEFKNFNTENGLPANEILDIREDNVGRIWLSCFNGKACYIKNSRIYTAKNDITLKQIEKDVYYNKELRKSEYLRFIDFQNKLIITHVGNGQNVEIDETGALIPLSYFLSVGDKIALQDYLIIQIKNQISLFDKRYQKLDSLIISKRSDLYNNIITGISIGDNEFVLTTNFGRLYRYSVYDNKIHFKEAFSTSFSIERLYNFNGTIWASHNGEQIYPVDRMNQFKADTINGLNLKGTGVNIFFIDREQNKWAGTPGNGLFLKPKSNFHYYGIQELGQSGWISCLAKQRNQTYLGYNNGTIRGLNNDLILRTEENKYLPRAQGVTKLLSLTDYIVAGFRNWYPLEIYQKGKNKKYTVDIANIKSLHSWKDHSFLVGTGARCYGVKLPNIITDTIITGRTTAVCPVQDDIYIGTLHGLFVYSKNDDGVWLSDAARTYPFLKNTKISALEAKKDLIAVGTSGMGFVLIRKGDTAQIKLEESGGSINCQKIVFDEAGSIWIVGYSTVYKLIIKNNNIHDYSVKKIDKSNGLLSNTVNDILVMGDSLLVATNKGLSLCSKKEWDSDSNSTPIYINEVFVNNHLYDIAWTDLELPFDSNTIAFNFSAIDYKSNGYVRFKYRLKGLDDRWQYDTKNRIQFESLQSGTYTFELMAANVNNQWSTKPVVFSFTIKPPWWRHSLFLAIMSILCLGLVIVIVRKVINDRHNKRLRALLFQKQMTETELKAIKAQINPHFLFNALNSVQYFINAGKKESADLYLSNLANVLRKTLDFSGRTGVRVEEEIDFLNSYLDLESMKFESNFSYRIMAVPEPAVYQSTMPSMVLQPHIENALRHGLKPSKEKNQHIDIRFYLNQQQLICEIEDNGIGRVASKTLKKNKVKNRSSKGIALAVSKLKMYSKITGNDTDTQIIDLYQLHNENVARGTLVRITITYNE